MINTFIAGDKVVVLNDSSSVFPTGSVATVLISGNAGVYLQVGCSEESIYYSLEEVAPWKFKPNDVVRYIGESVTFSLDTGKLYVINSSEMYGGALYVADDVCDENFLIDSKPEMFTLVYREGV